AQIGAESLARAAHHVDLGVQAEVTAASNLVAGLGHDGARAVDDNRAERRLAVGLRGERELERAQHEAAVVLGGHWRTRLGSNNAAGAGAFLTSLDPSAKSTTEVIDLKAGAVSPL